MSKKIITIIMVILLNFPIFLSADEEADDKYINEFIATTDELADDAI
jgi:hypothetical protein